uniref:Non-symbiotic hemoglobin 2 n=1 Tax=Lepeophtheirus salmonis TaxID=72036 RepID=D3PG04_LEPSM|nr:Non-symbiotic hemoglobin 2 [Lepeophtheirus salmonis]
MVIGKKLKRHGGIVMKALGKLVGFLETGKIIAIVNTIKGIANSHSKRGVLVQQFTPICDILLKYLGEAFGDQLSNEGTATWKKFLDIFVSVINEAYDEIKNKK